MKSRNKCEHEWVYTSQFEQDGDEGWYDQQCDLCGATSQEVWRGATITIEDIHD